MQIPHGSTQQPENQYLSQFIAGAISGGLEGRISIFNETAVLIQAATEVNQKIGGMVQQIGMQSIVDIDNKERKSHALKSISREHGRFLNREVFLHRREATHFQSWICLRGNLQKCTVVR